jgi:hypothetical protein
MNICKRKIICFIAVIMLSIGYDNLYSENKNKKIEKSKTTAEAKQESDVSIEVFEEIKRIIEEVDKQNSRGNEILASEERTKIENIIKKEFPEGKLITLSTDKYCIKRKDCFGTGYFNSYVLSVNDTFMVRLYYEIDKDLRTVKVMPYNLRKEFEMKFDSENSKCSKYNIRFQILSVNNITFGYDILLGGFVINGKLLSITENDNAKKIMKEYEVE